MLQRAAAHSELSVPNFGKSWGSEIDDGRPKHGLLENQVRTVVTKSPIARTCDPAGVKRILQLSTTYLHGWPSSAPPSLPRPSKHRCYKILHTGADAGLHAVLHNDRAGHSRADQHALRHLRQTNADGNA